jgi:soluble lytic murein transglycosylase
MKRLVIIILILLVLAAGGLYAFDQYWIHRYDPLIEREARRAQVDPDLVWSVVYEETYFRPWKRGQHGEIGLMQVTPIVAREWVADNSPTPPEQSNAVDAETILGDAERNVQIGCWYLQKSSQEYHDTPGREARMLAAYNAGPSRAADWNRVSSGSPPLSEQEFIARIDIPSTRAYVTSILARYHRLKSSKSSALLTSSLMSQESLSR